MKKAVCLAIVAAFLFIGCAGTGKFSTEVVPVTIHGVPCQVVKVTNQGGPANGFFGTTGTQFATYELAKDGYPAKLSEYGYSSDGLGKGLVQGVAKAATFGAFYIGGQAVRRPDTSTTNVNTTGVNNPANSVANTVGVANSVSNKVFQAQGQGQAQFQNQNQGQIQSQKQELF